jgi:predicted dehydrogenase
MIRFGVIGTSWITEEFIKCARLTGDCFLDAVYSRDKEKAGCFAAKHGMEHTFTNINEMAQSQLIDAVYIASPNSLHASQAVLFMSQGKHVLCEKPIASNTKELSAMIEASKKNNVLLMEAIKTTFLPNFQAIVQNIHKLGKIRKFFSNYCQYSSRYDGYKDGKTPNTFQPEFSNGSIMDIGIYCIYPAIYLFGKPEKVSANGIMLDSGIDGAGSISLHYQDMEVIISHSKISNSAISSEIQGEDGVIVIDKISTPEMVKVFYRDGSEEGLEQEQSKDLMVYEVREFIDCIKNNRIESRINSLQLSLDVMGIMETSRKQIGLVFPADK